MTSYTFQDEFDGPAGSPPDPARWSYDLGAGGWGNNELQSYTDDPRNVFQDGRSHLVIRATRQVTAASGDTEHSLPQRADYDPGQVRPVRRVL